MSDSPHQLVLGFLGGGAVRRENAIALIEEFITAHHRNNKGAEVAFYIGIEPFTESLNDLADYCTTSGYKLGLVGHEAALRGSEVAPYLRDAEGRKFAVPDKRSIGDFLVKVIAVGDVSPRLFILADPDEDDATYLAVETAISMSIPVRTLLGGLEMVIMETDEEEETLVMSPVRDDEEEIYDESDVEEDELEDDLDEPDPDEIEDAELIEDEDLDEGELEEEPDEEEDAVEDIDDSDEPEDEEPEGDEENEEEEMPARRASKKAAASNGKWTQSKLEALADRDRDEFYALAAQYSITPGRGIKISNMVTRILEALGEPVAKRTPTKKVAKKRVVKKKAIARKAPAKKAAAKKRPATRTVPPKRAAVVAVPSTNSKVEHAAALKLIDGAQKALEAAAKLL